MLLGRDHTLRTIGDRPGGGSWPRIPGSAGWRQVRLWESSGRGRLSRVQSTVTDIALGSASLTTDPHSPSCSSPRRGPVIYNLLVTGISKAVARKLTGFHWAKHQVLKLLSDPVCSLGGVTPAHRSACTAEKMEPHILHGAMTHVLILTDSKGVIRSLSSARVLLQKQRP